MSYTKTVASLLPFAWGLAIAGSPALAEVYPFDFLKCGTIACADVYQGEGVDHPQLVVHIFPKAGGLNGIDYTYIADFDPSGDGAFQLYLGNTLIEHHGPNSVVYLPEGYAEAISPYGIYLSEGLELAFTAPYTADYDWWPGQNVLNEIVAEGVDDIPEAFHAWDEQNGTGSPESTGSSGMSGQAVGGSLADPDRLCEIMSLEGICTDVERQSFAVGVLTATATPETKATAIRARFAPVLSAPRAMSLRRLNRTIAARPPTAASGPPGGSNCTNLGLVSEYASGGLPACYEKCDLCAQQDIEDWTFDVGKLCGATGTGTAFFATLLSDGLALPGAVSIATGVGGACAGYFLHDLSSTRIIRRKSCMDTCDYLDALAND